MVFRYRFIGYSDKVFRYRAHHWLLIHMKYQYARSRSQLFNGNDIVINTYEIQQIHITFY